MSCLHLVQGDLVKCVYFKMNLTVKNKALGKLIRKIVVGKVLPNMFFFCLGLAKIVFQLDAVKFAMLFWVSHPGGKASDQVCRLCQVQGKLVFISYGSQVRFEQNNWFQS